MKTCRKSRILCCVLCAATLFSLWSLGLSFAGNEQDRLNKVNKDKNAVQQQLNAGKKEAKKLNNEIAELEKKINAAESEIKDIQSDISKTQSNIAETERNMARVKEEMVEQNDNMNARLVAMYKNDDTNVLEVLLGSADISEFLTNLDMVQRIYDSDVDLLEAMQANYDKIEQQKKELESMQQQLESQQQQQKERQDALESDQDAVQNKKAAVEKNNAALEEQIDAFNKEAAALEAQIRALQGNGTYSGGALGWPVPGISRVTSEFGSRLHPVLKVQKMHTGMDIGAPRNSTVVAAADGKVIMATYNGSYGNVVMIDHGSGIVTVYAHNTTLLVSKGQSVTRGQTIAKSGDTGRVTGPHVHFEVRVNGVYKNPRSYL